ncbi:hemolysin III family protein [Cocleimonas sp. KMM 6892]|uniref:PAQR family membrane homeostasis protein TrhA n=1 Tax=unclassified Cocleimonas TaxID=2639732 RepID=UPI002DBEA37F|nr:MULTISPECIES: hemolysin III family protein [unclassified Cocleimonas]MEB8433773.1 hemolysin III family protein [Cocleimonas sp. KMM 6892]MEC4716584.1 hemolysin III family protein [Cocleimonas sp. KMM 6895]MEC4746261.1 hemolysin III family protein [Cocleimonas sp. KMM 6896]
MQQGEKFNTITHFLAAVLAVPGLIYLIVLAANTGDAWKIVSASIYGTTLLLLYISSTLCHGHSGRFRDLFEKLDHLSIYLLIAGTYTPYMLVTLRGNWGWTIFAVVWGLALIGMLIDVWPKDANKENKRIIPLIIYLVMGWLVIIPIQPLTESLASTGVWLLAVGGVLYTVGVVFFILSDRVKHAHGVWHLFVIGGSLSHYISISAYVI